MTRVVAPCIGKGNAVIIKDCLIQQQDINPSPPVLNYIRQSQNVKSFDPSGSTWFYMQKREEVDLSHEKWKKKKKNLYYGWERIIYTEKLFSVTRWMDEV